MTEVKNRKGWFFTLVLAFLFSFGAAGGAWASKSDLITIAAEKQRQDPTLVLTQGMAEVIDLEGPVADVMVANPSVVDVMALQSHRLYLVGAGLGSTNIIAVDESGDIISRLNVHVKVDDQPLQNLINELFPEEHVVVRSLTDQIVMTGQVSSPSVAEEVMTLASHYIGEIYDEDFDHIDQFVVNMLQVGGENQVMLRMKIVEASREVLKELGVETYLNNPNPDDILYGVLPTSGEDAALFGLTPPTNIGALGAAQFLSNSQVGLTEDPMAAIRLIKDTTVGGLGMIEMAINALETTNLVNTLAEPNLTALSGEQAGFLAGGEFPVPVGRDRDGNIIIEYHPFGVSLNFKPVVLGNDLISLQMETEVSALSNQNSLTLQEINIPGFSVRRASTTVEMASGGSLMIAGLLKSDVAKGMAGLPGVNDVPILGDLLSSDSFQREESELVIIVTPYLVQPYADKKDIAQEVPGLKENPLAVAFSDNVSGLFKDGVLPSALFNEDKRYGYLID